MLGLRWADIDIAHSAIGFSRAYVDGPTGPVLRATKTHRTYRASIDDAACRRLVDHHRRANQRAVAAGQGLTRDAYVFTNAAGGAVPWLPNRVTKMFIDHRRRAGIAHFRLHDLRHFMATQMLAHGIAVPTVSARLGHARASTTLNVYAHSVPGADRAAADFIGGLLAR